MRVYASVGRTNNVQRHECVRALCSRLGGSLINAGIPDDADLFLSWGMRSDANFHAAVRRGCVSIVLDRGFFDATRFERFSIHVQGSHGLSMPLSTVLDLPPREHPELQPWRDTEGEFVQIITPGAGDGYWRTPDVDRRLPASWVNEVATEASQTFHKPAKIRYHPRALPQGERVPPPLDTTFAETHVSVSYLSLAGVQTVIAGIPSVILHPRSMAFPMGCTYMGIVRPNREAWIHDLSHREYHMRDGTELDAACEYILQAYAEAKRLGPLKSPLRRYGIKGE